MAQQEDSAMVDADTQPANDPSINLTSAGGSPKDVSDVDPTAPYGTRSRQRNGTSRPNYAEDKDIDSDVYDFYQDEKGGQSKKRPKQAAAAAANGDVTRSSGSARKSNDDDGKAAASQNGTSKEQSASVAPSPASQATQTSASSTQPSRKRKAAAQQQTASSNSSSAPSKKNGVAVYSSASSWPETNMLTFEKSKSRPQNGRLVADDGTVLEANDHVYLVCEPPGEPYYLGRIMEFLHPRNDTSQPIDALRINWYYRPKDIGRKVQDTRFVFATMHSDVSPLTALRGKCQIRHRVEIQNMDSYRKTPDSFWYEKLYDRYIQKNYDIIPTAAIVNVPERVKKVLDDRWKYVLVEQGRGKELTSAVKLCKRCGGYCASNDSVDCAVCHNTYHMNCVKPPLLKKPSRGFAWSCAACSRAQERKLEAQHAPNAAESFGDLEDDEVLDEEEDDLAGCDTGRTSPDDDGHHHHHHHHGTAEQIYQASLWPYRYLGMHCKPEDALDYDDRIYPRASTRIGPRHQAAVGPWPGRPVQYEKPVEKKKSGRKDGKLSKEAQAAIEAEKARREQRPKWIQDEPPGYSVRGEDFDESDPNCTAAPIWKPPPENVLSSEDIEQYMDKARKAAQTLGLPERSTNLQDVALGSLFQGKYDTKQAFKLLMAAEKEAFKEPILSAAEQKKFEEAISKHGSELQGVRKHVKTMTPGQVVRYYYTWKKSERGRQVWGSYTGRKGKKEAKRAEAAASKLADDVADRDDDSAYDAGKAVEKKRSFRCQFCATTSSRQWRRAPNPTPGLVNNEGKPMVKEKGGQYIVALCRRCAELWRRYAIRFEDLDEVAKKVALSGNRAWKRRQDEELLKELQAAQEMGLMTPDRGSTPSNGNGILNGSEPPRKKLKGAPEKDPDQTQSDSGSGLGPAAAAAAKKKDREREKAKERQKEKVQDKDKEKASESPVVPDMPKPRTLPCAICDQLEPLGDQHVSCRDCRLTVHRRCYGVVDSRVQGKWVCDMCTNDKNPQVSIHYKCVLCPHETQEHDLIELPKLTHHKKKMSEKDREREKLEVQQARKAAETYKKKQEDMNRPVNPREPLKRTADNNWVHVTCAVWTPEVKFGKAKAMEPSEGIPSIPRPRYDEVCQACNKKGGACVACHQCRAPVHVECAHHHGYMLGFEITPVKSSRRDQHNIVTFKGETGMMSAAVWCKEHVPIKTIVHQMHDAVDESGLNALQFYAQNCKPADLTLTGTVRKANLMTMAAKMSGAPVQPSARRHSTAAMPNGAAWTSRGIDVKHLADDALQPGSKICISCGVDVSLKWWPTPVDEQRDQDLANGQHGVIGSEAQKFVEQRRFQCHKCHKEHRAPRPPQVRQKPQRAPDTSVAAPALSSLETSHTRPPPSLRSPASVAPVPVTDYRDRRPTAHAWPQPFPPTYGDGIWPPSGERWTPSPPPPSQARRVVSRPPPPSPPPAAPIPVANHRERGGLDDDMWRRPPPREGLWLPSGEPWTPSPPLPSQARRVVSRQPPQSPPPASAYTPAAPSRAAGSQDWAPRPGSQHGSPLGLLNGGQPPIVGGPPPPPGISSLRPPAISGPPPPTSATHVGASHPHLHAPASFVNGMPPSPRRVSGVAPPPAYLPPLSAAPSRGALPQGSPRGIGTEGPSPSTARSETFHHGLHPGRPSYPGSYGNLHAAARSGMPPGYEQPSQTGPSPPRPSEPRPASGASSSASLRNLLS